MCENYSLPSQRSYHWTKPVPETSDQGPIAKESTLDLKQTKHKAPEVATVSLYMGVLRLVYSIVRQYDSYLYSNI